MWIILILLGLLGFAPGPESGSATGTSSEITGDPAADEFYQRSLAIGVVRCEPGPQAARTWACLTRAAKAGKSATGDIFPANPGPKGVAIIRHFFLSPDGSLELYVETFDLKAQTPPPWQRLACPGPNAGSLAERGKACL